MPGYKIEKFDNMQLKLFAMACMLCDHVGAVFFPGLTWTRIVGRLAFPIFAFEIAEGFALTRDRGKYILRMFLFGILAEYPFQTVIRGRGFSVGMTNVLFSFFVCLVLMENAILQASGKELLPMYSMIAGGLVKIAVNWFLVADPRINIYGAPIGTLSETLGL